MEKTIIYFGNVLYPDLDAASHRTIGNAKALRELGYNVVLIGTRKGETRPVLETKEVFAGFDIYYFADLETPLQWKEYLFGFNPLKEVLSTQEYVEAVILYNHPSISTKKINSFCHNRGIKVYSDCTEWFDPHGFSFHNVIKRMDTWYRMRRVNLRLDGVIAISSFLDSFYKTRGCRTISVPPLVDLKDSKWEYSEIDNNKPQSDCIGLCYVGNAGTGFKDKLDLIIKSLKNVKDAQSEFNFQLTIVGMTLEQYIIAFRDNSTNIDFVRFCGKLPNKETLDIVKKSDYSIFLRDNNLVCTAGFPTKFSESLACGTPVLTNITSDLKQYLKDGINGFVMDTDSEDALIESLKKALSVSRTKMKEMKEWCKNEKTFDYHSFVGEFSKMF